MRVRNFFTRNLGIKFVSLILALMVWFYIVGELNKGSEEERMLLRRVIPPGDMIARKLPIRPLFVGNPKKGYIIDEKKVIVMPEYCIVVGSREIMGNIKAAYTMPIDIDGLSKSFTKSVALNPVASGIYMEETFVQVTVPVERENS